MRSTMQEISLSIRRVMDYGTSVHGSSEVITWTADGGRRATFSDVGRRARRLANALRTELGIRGDERVATLMWNNQEHLEAYLAVPSMGAVLHTLNIRLTPDQLIYIANHAEDQVVIVDGTLIPLLARVLPRLESVRHVVVTAGGDPGALAGLGKAVHSYDDLLAGQPEEFPWFEIDERAAAAMCYTSGTTGDPKGVVYSHRSAYIHSMQVAMGDVLALSQAERVLPVVPMFHAMAWGVPYAAMMVGSSLVLPDRFLQAEPLAALIETERPTLAAAVPTIWNDLLHFADDHGSDLSSLHTVMVGGSACPLALMKAFQERYGIRVLHGWGMTETSPVGSIARPPTHATGDDEWRYRATQGRVLVNVEARLVGPDGTVLPHDGEQVGELEVRGPYITGSYYRDDDPAKFHDGWLRTGDVGKITPDGFLTLTDRAKDVIKSGGEWISSVELENHLMGHPAVLEASVVGVPDERWGERPLATVVVRQGGSVTPDELRDFLADKVARWQLPERWAFIDEVPKTSVGKFDKKLLRKRYADGELEVKTVG